MDIVFQRVTGLPSNKDAVRALDAVGLKASTVTWEDTARAKNSAWGNNISDMTLTANGRDLPVIRLPNFADVTYDVPHGNIMLTVGNEHGEAPRQVSLQEYLTHIGDHLHEPLKYTGKSLFDAARDVNVLMSSQACMLPVPMGDGQKTTFAVTLRNYQSAKDRPAVAVIVASDSGTSFHVINASGKERLYHNKNGERCQFLGERLGAFRRAQGRPDDGSPMNKEEKAKNVLMVIQVPLKRAPVVHSGNFSFGGDGGGFGPGGMAYASPSFGGGGGGGSFSFGSGNKYADKIINSVSPKQWEQEMECASGVALPDGDDDDIYVPVKESTLKKSPSGTNTFQKAKKAAKPASDFWGDDDDDVGEADVEDDSMDVVDIEHAIVSVGPTEGPYDELCGRSTIERDTRYPIRVTLQFYRATTSGQMTPAIASEIAQQFREARAAYGAVAAGSLVLTDASGRTTEMQKKKVRPAWWDTFLETHWPQFKAGYASQEAMGDLLFQNGRFTQSGMQECEARVLRILKANAAEKL